MHSRESDVVAQIRLKQWAEEIQACMNRPKGISVEQWCMQHGVKKSNYYWRLRRVRQACLDTTEVSERRFVELPVLTETTVPSVTANLPALTPVSVTPVAVLHTNDGLSIELTEHASADFLKTLLGVLANA